MKRAGISLCLLLFSVLLFQGCTTLGEVFRTLTSLKNLQFRLDAIGDITYPERITIISREFR